MKSFAPNTRHGSTSGRSTLDANQLVNLDAVGSEPYYTFPDAGETDYVFAFHQAKDNARRFESQQETAREEMREKHLAFGDDDDDAGALGRFHAHRVAEQLFSSYLMRTIVPACRDLGDYDMADEQMRQALKHQQCRTSGFFGINDGGNVIVAWDTKCSSSKYCPDEATKAAKQFRERYEPEIKRRRELGYQIYKVWPTLPNYPGGRLAEGQRHIFKRFRDKLIRPKINGRNKFGIRGALVIGESPLSKNRDWNVHLNAILIVDDRLDYKAVREQWGCNIEMRKHKDFSDSGMHGLFSEMVKYSTQAIPSKSNDEKHRHNAPAVIEWTPAEYLEFYRANKGHRRARAYGCLHGIGKPEREVSYPDTWLGRLMHRPDGYSIVWRKHDLHDVLKAVAENAGPYAGLGLDSIRGDKSTRHNRGRRSTGLP